MKSFFLGVQLARLQNGIVSFQFQSCLANALEGCRSVPCKVRSIVGCNPNVVHVLSLFVSFVNWVEYSGRKLEKAETDLLRPCASLSYAEILIKKLKGSISTDRCSANRKQ